VKFILYHVTRFEPITAAHFDQPYNNTNYNKMPCYRMDHRAMRSKFRYLSNFTTSCGFYRAMLAQSAVMRQ